MLDFLLSTEFVLGLACGLAVEGAAFGWIYWRFGREEEERSLDPDEYEFAPGFCSDIRKQVHLRAVPSN